MRELLWGLRAVDRELRRWRMRAAAISDPSLRGEALHSLTDKRANTDGAALFSILTRRRRLCLLRVLVAYEVMSDFLDGVNERSAHAGLANGCHLHGALTEAVDIGVAVSDHYRYHPSAGDGGYLRGLVTVCRALCVQLPSYPAVRPFLIRSAALARVQGLNHELGRDRREAALRTWAAREFSGERELSWFELAGAASAWLTVLALLALAAEPGSRESDGMETYAAYFPWVALTATMLDSYVDAGEDAANGTHNCMAYYPSAALAVRRTRECLRRSIGSVRSLRNGRRHAVILACMVAMYLSKDDARVREVCPMTRLLAQAGGALTRVLLPILRIWRIAYGQRSA
ncbi:MAG TPA: DUF2600 family protein [Solirubrobacteraceae bacterium]